MNKWVFQLVFLFQANLAVQQSKYDKANQNLREAEGILKQKDEDLRIVQNEFDAVIAERQEIVDLADACQAKMDTASALIGGLSGERIRWTNQLTLFRSEIERLTGDAVILTAFLFYCGPFNQEFRSLLQKHWINFIQGRKIAFSVDVNVTDALSDVATINEWNLQGLPNDELSTQNAIIVTNASRYPLLIDPQLQGKTWIKNKESECGLQITNLSHKYFRNHLEDCVSLGNPLLIEDVMEELDPILDNLLDKNFLKMGTSLKVILGDKEVDMNKDFRMYITTKFPNPSYTPEIFARTSIIDFSVTMKGLEDQLLSRVILAEKRELETGRTKLVTDITANKRKIQELEANLLHKLTTVQGSLLDDVELMTVLTTTQKTAAEVTLKLNLARDTEIKVNIAREEFRSVATRGSVLYFLICDMSKVNCMYQTSLMQFLERFDLSLIRSEKSPVISKRINTIIEVLTHQIYAYTARGLYENHKFLFLIMMTLKIDLQRRSISHEEFEYFIKGGAGLDLSTIRPKQCKWITDKTWLNLTALTSLRQFQHVLALIEASEKVWKNWYDKEAPELEVIPDGFNNLDSFRRLLFIRIVRVTLQNLLLAIEGVIIMNEDLRDTLDNIYDARIPNMWRSRSWNSSTLGFWITELLERNQQFSKWITIGRPDSFWMSGFFNPQGFLTAMRQEVARAHKGWALDNVTLYNEVTRQMIEEIRSPPNEGVYVHGLFLEGGGWDRRNNRLRESINKILHVEMPVILISALSGKIVKDVKLLYECPVYKKPMRTYITFIVSLSLPTNRPPEFWILRGVALLCDNK
ncbi:dynein heavy chain 8, axonemal-like [Fopius arisanus]|uniref:Dynein heavy chain 8, axonemal-like n=1 Tax=Fopius arisanus TaxID=64838 RepID=A0A9R1TK90_9HYME|nr:PREDICTED: dynein heavy chain 8, axonemal-like [Fopius arisanus]